MARRTREAPRRKYQWIRESIPPTEITDDGGSSGVELLRVTDAEILAAGMHDPTVVRIRGSSLLRMDPATSADGVSQRIVMGVMVLPASVTFAEHSGPLSTPNDDWMYWNVVQLASPTLPAASEEEWGTGSWRVDFDVKVSRRLRGKSGVVLGVESAGDSAAHVFVSASWSVLLQE